jgi:hypothetical protein
MPFERKFGALFIIKNSFCDKNLGHVVLTWP